MRTFLPPFVSLALLASGCSSDSPEDTGPSPEARAFASKVCSTRHECGCVDDRFSSHQECRSEIEKSFDAQVQAGARVDKACLEETLTSEALNGCPPWVWAPEMWSCPVLVISRKEGEACSVPSDLQPLSISVCAPGLDCIQGVCRLDTGQPPPLKTYAVGDPCTSTEGCGGKYCGYDHSCHERVASGGVCDHPYGCEAGLYCEGLGKNEQGVCVEPRQPNEACDPRDWVACASPNFPEEVNACDPEANRCLPDQPGICRLTHALIAKQ